MSSAGGCAAALDRAIPADELRSQLNGAEGHAGVCAAALDGAIPADELRSQLNGAEGCAGGCAGAEGRAHQSVGRYRVSIRRSRPVRIRPLRREAILVVVGLLALIGACGNEPPTPGELAVDSTPAGAAIILDGQDTGVVTPHTFGDLEGGSYAVTVALDEWSTFPEQMTVRVPYGGTAYADFTLSQDIGSLLVTSTPPGAAILLDDEETGQTTPHTFAAVPAGEHVVAVALDNHLSESGPQMVTVVTGEQSSVDFSLQQVDIPRVVLMEGFSNVYCSGCATLAANMEFVMHEDGYGRDRLVYVKWPAFLSPLDPFWRQTQTITDARVTAYYGGPGTTLPALRGDGVVLGSPGSPINADGIMSYVDEQPEFADFGITVSTDEDLTDVDDLSHEATITVYTVGGADLTGHALHVVLVYDQVESAIDYPFGNGTEHHWVLRDHVQLVDDLGALAQQASRTEPVTLTDPLAPPEIDGHDIYPQAKAIIAFVQNTTTKAVLQAGSTLTSTTSLSTRTDDARVPARRDAPGGNR